MGIRLAIKYGTLAMIIALGVWLLWPPPDEGENGVGKAAVRRRSDARFVIKFSPGAAYLPGTMPFGVGKPLEGLTKVIAAFEQRFPDTQVEVLNVPAVREYLVTQLSSGQAPDIINVNVEDVWMDVQKGWYIPLDEFLEAPNPFVVEKGDPSLPGSKQWWDMFRYQAISRGKAAPDNCNYCISFDMVETGIYYNKDIFKELGLPVPQTWEEFLSLMAKIKASGRLPLLMHMGAYHDWAMDLFFDQLYYDLLTGIDLYQDPVREKYLRGYLDWDELVFLRDKGFFNRRDPRYVEVWRRMRELKKYTNKDLVSTDVVREFVTQKAAMLWTASSLTYRLWADKKLGFEWGVFYLPRFTKKTSKYASGRPMCVIGGSATQIEVTNSAVGDTDANLPLRKRMALSKRLKRVIAFLQFMCQPEQYTKVVNEYPGYVPNVVGVDVRAELKPFEEILERRYTTTKWVFTFDLQFSEIQMRMLALYLTDGIGLDEFLAWQEKNLAAACKRMVRRKRIDLVALEKSWRKLAPARAKMRDLPPPPEDK